MKKRQQPKLTMIWKGLLFFFAIPLAGAGLAITLQISVKLVDHPFRIPVAIIAYTAYIYAVGRWVFCLKPRPLLSKLTKEKLQRLLRL